MNKDPYPRAIVPEFLVQRTLETAALETAYYIDPGDYEDFYGSDTPALSVMPDGELHVRLSTPVEPEDIAPSSLAGRVGIMRVGVLHEGRIQEGLIADLRFLQEGQLAQNDDTPPDEPEEFNAWLKAKSDLRPVVAFIAPGDADDEDGVLYGPEAFRDALIMLREKTDKMIRPVKNTGKKRNKSESKSGDKTEKAKKKAKQDNQAAASESSS
jgi:hypothetical protein